MGRPVTYHDAEHRKKRAQDKARYLKNPKTYRDAKKAWRKDLKIQAIAKYGGACACCKVKDWEFLTIDHVDGGGNAHRKAIGNNGGYHFYLWLREHGYPPRYRVLCMNCHLSISKYGYCPHQK